MGGGTRTGVYEGKRGGGGDDGGVIKEEGGASLEDRREVRPMGTKEREAGIAACRQSRGAGGRAVVGRRGWFNLCGGGGGGAGVRGGRLLPRERPRRDAASPGLHAVPHRLAAAWEDGCHGPRRRWGSGDMSSLRLAAPPARRGRGPPSFPSLLPAGRARSPPDAAGGGRGQRCRSAPELRTRRAASRRLL